MELLIPQNQNCAPREPLRPFSKFRERGRLGFFIFGLWLMLSCLGLNVARGQTVSHEYPLKAVFLFNFAQFTDWPTNAFDKPDSPLVIGVLGDDPFGALLDDAVRGETVNGRKFAVERYLHVEDIKTCHILFISQSETRRLDKIEAGLKGKPVLTVSDIDNSAYRGVCVQFVTINNKIHLRINLDSLKDANLTMSSKLLRVSEIISLPTQ
ncbi:MAG: YfiR family protein [Verrucomicrobiota bacterium]